MTDSTESFERNQSRKLWTMSEIETVRQNAHLGSRTIAILLDRTESSVKHLANRLRISLRPSGERRGTLLGQPRGVRWVEQQGVDPARLELLRAEVLDGTTDLEALEKRVREIALGFTRPTCPSCGVRPQDRASTGLCEVCHLRALAQAHRDDTARRDAQRELWRTRQESSRTRRAAE